MIKRWLGRPLELVISAGILIVLAGMILPAMRSARIRDDIERATIELGKLRDAVQAFYQDTKVGPCLSQDGPRGLHWLVGPGEIPGTAYAIANNRPGFLGAHLMENSPDGPEKYEGWNGPYLEELESDPWGKSYLLVIYSMFLDDDRDCIVISAGPNGRLDSSYSSPRDPIPAGDDLIEVIFDKSLENRAPLF